MNTVLIIFISLCSGSNLCKFNQVDDKGTIGVEVYRNGSYSRAELIKCGVVEPKSNYIKWKGCK